MVRLNLKHWLSLILFIGFLVVAPDIWASTTGSMPFNTAAQNFKQNLMAFIFVASIILIMAMALMLAFGDFGDGMKKMITIIFWLSVALSAGSFVGMLFTSGAVM